MLRTLLTKEILDSLTSRRFFVIALLCLIMIPLGVTVSTKDYDTRLHNHQEAVRLYEESTEKVQHILYGGGGKAFRPPSPLSFIAMGLENVLPNIAETPAKSFQAPVSMSLSNNQSLDNLYESYHGSLDLVFIVAVIMTFLAMVSTYSAVSGEKEQGTLKQILCNAVPRHKILLAKMGAHFLALLIPFVASLVLSFLIVPAGTRFLSGTLQMGTAFALAGLFSLLLLGIFFNLGLLVSSLTKQAATTIVVLLLLWVFLFGVHPRLSAVVARLIYPVKPEPIVALEKNQLRRDNERELNAEIDRLMAPYSGRRSEIPDEALEGQRTLRRQYQARLVERWGDVDREVARRQTTQVRIASNLARLSPVACFIRPMAEISRTGWLEYRRFSSDVGRFEQILNRDIYERNVYTRLQGGISQSFEGDIDAPAPRFEETRISGSDLLRNVLPDLALLVFFNLLLFSGAFVAFLKYDVR